MAAQDLDFPDRHCDLVLTSVVLLHVPPEKIQAAAAEIVRVSAQWIIVAEYSQVDVAGLQRKPTHDHVFAHDYRKLFEQAGARLQHVRQVPFRTQELLLFSR